MSDFQKALEQLINQYSQENGSNTPDFILAKYLAGCLENFNAIVTERERWHGRALKELTVESVDVNNAVHPNMIIQRGDDEYAKSIC